ncbi:MAG: LysM peptidoglycan-binding domain-containing protein [Chitinophagales bacterium]
MTKAGCGTDPQYANKLSSVIERYSLSKFDLPGGIDCDNIVLDLPAITYYNRIKTVIFTCDITIAQVARAYKMDEKSLRKYNDFDTDVIPANNKVYFQPKRNKGPFGLRKHIVARGETMVSISQLYGIKLKHLYKRNRMDMGKKQHPAVGQELNLRGKRKSSPQLSTAPIVKPTTSTPTPPPVFVPKPSTDDVDIDNSDNTDETDINDFEITPPVVNPPKTGAGTKDDVVTPPTTDDNDIPSSISHIVQKGETLYAISRKYKVPVQTIKALNNMTSNDLKVGQALKIK